MDTLDAAKAGDLIMILTPDQVQADIFKESIEENLEEGNVLSFSHGFNIHFCRSRLRKCRRYYGCARSGAIPSAPNMSKAGECRL